MVNASKNEDLMRKAHQYAGTRSTIIATANMASGGLAAKPLTLGIQNVVGKELVNVAIQVPLQAGIEGAGELGAQLATDEYEPGEILAEMTGSLAQTPIEVGAAAVTGIRGQQRANQIANVESEINKMLGRDNADANPPPAPTPENDPFLPQPDDGTMPPDIDFPIDREPGPGPETIEYPPGDVFDQTPDPTAQGEDNLQVRYRQVATDEVNVGLDSIQSPSDAAHVFAFLRKRGQEAFYALITDANGKPINMIRHTEGVKDASNVDPATVVAAAANTPGAAAIYYGHNHPSGVMEPSRADLNITGKINQALQGTDIEFKGHILVGAPTGKALHFDSSGKVADIDITPARRNKRLPITTRQLRRRAPGELTALTSPTQVKDYAKSLESKNALLLLDNRNQVIGVSTFGPGELGNLREGGRVNRILSALDASNASGMIIVSDNADNARNVARMANNLGGLRVLDALVHGETMEELRASTETGQGIESETGTFAMQQPAPAPRETGPQAPQYFDQRLRRATYRRQLQALGEELTPGGGVTYLWEDDKIVGRTPSVNPEWFQNMNMDPDYRMSVEKVQNAINKAITGKKLGVREQRVVQALVDTITDERLAQVDYAREDLQRARDLRSERRRARGMQPDPELESAGERYSEDEYAPEMSADSRIIFEMMEDAVALNIDEGILERLSIQYDDSQNQQLMDALQELIDEQRRQAGAQAAAPQPAPREIPAVTRDIFGDDTANAQAIADEIRRRDAARVAGQDQVETGDPTDLFSQARDQVDIDDQVLSARVPPKEAPPQTSPTADTVQQERRARLQRMSLEELVDAFYTDPMTGIGNRAAFDEEIASHNFVASIDADSLKWINDNLGHDAGDAMLISIADAMKATGLDAYRIGGDEFYLGGPTREAVEAALDLINGHLANQTISSPNGSKQGIEATSAIGTDKASADSRMEVEKKRKKGRAERGAAPEGVTLSHKAGPTLAMQPGTNYVSIIGQTGSLPIDANHNYILGSTGKPVRIPKKPVRREHILAVMQKYFGARIYQGRVKGKMRLGFYRPGQGELRLKNHNDVEVAAHEIAHWLDDRYPWIKQLYNQYLDEVKSVSYDVKLNYEGYAEFMRLWFTQESEVMQRTPSFYDAFNKEVQKKSPQMWKMLTDLQELMHAWHLQGARARGLSKVGNIESVFDKMRRLIDVNVFQQALDGLRSIKTIAADLSDISAPIITDAYERLRLAIGGANGVIEAAFFFGTPRWRADGQGIELGGESLREIFGDYWGSDEVAMYMVARRAEELLGQGRENLMRPDEIAAWLQWGDARPELADIFTRYQAYNDRILDFAETGGILNPTTRKAFQEMNRNYVPFHRVIESQVSGKRVQQGGNPFQRLSGGTQNINNIWENIINNSGHIIRLAMVNDGKRALFSELRKGGRLGGTERNAQAGVYAAPIGKDTKPVQVDREQVLKNAAEAMGVPWRSYKMARDTGMYPPGPEGDYLEAMVAIIDSMAEGLDDMVTFWKFNQDPTGDNVDFYMDGGEKIFMEINDKNLMDSLRFMGPRGSNLVLQIAGGFSATLRRGVVAVPVFQLKNFVRDTTNAWLLSSNVKVPAARALRVVFSQMSKDPAYVEMLLNGGGFANRSQGLQAQRKVIVDPTRMAAAYDRFMGRFENANRLAEYKAARAGGQSPRRAALASREISTDFAMRGSSELARYLAVAVPFLNARVQGLYRVTRQFDRKELATSYAIRGLALAGATMALYALNKDDERYKELPEDIKDLYWVFFTGPGEDDYFLLPKPFESGMLFATIPERIFQYTEDRDGKEFADALAWMMMETFNMDMTPQIFQPWQDLRANKNFTGAPIIPHYLENVEPTEQYTYYTSEAVREAAQAMGMSPIKMEYVLRGYLGTLGTYAIGAADAMVTAATSDPQFGEEMTRGETWRENIIVRALIDPLVQEGPPRRTKYVTDLYDMIREAEKVAGTVGLHEKRNVNQVETYLNDPEKLVKYSSNEALNNARTQLSAIRVSMDQIRQDKEMTGDEKRLGIWELTRERNRIAREAVIQIKAAQEQEERILAEEAEAMEQRAAGAQ